MSACTLSLVPGLVPGTGTCTGLYLVDLPGLDLPGYGTGTWYQVQVPAVPYQVPVATWYCNTCTGIYTYTWEITVR